MAVKKRGLGRSLDALLVGSAKSAQDDDDREQLTHLPIHALQSGKYQPRRGMDPQALEELASSIRAQGIIQPIVVRAITEGKYEIIAGERRWRAAQLAGLKDVPSLIRNIPDEATVAVALIENIQRESLNAIEEAIALQRLLEEFSMTHQQVADAIGKSRASVSNLLRLLSLSDPVRLMLEHGDIEMGHARALLSLSSRDQLIVAQAIVAKNLSVREAEKYVQNLQNVQSVQAPRQAPDAGMVKLQQDLSTKIKLPVAIQTSAKGKGKIVISYRNLKELDKLIEYFQ